MFNLQQPGEYDVPQVEALGTIEAIRKRPTLYIGTTSRRGLRFLVFELVSNSIDEALAGYCKNIEVTLHPDNSITVEDDGRGIPIKPFKDTGKTAVEVILTTLFTGAKFGGTAYKVSRGTYGVSLAVVNALSEWLEIEVKRDGKVFFQRYERGKPKSPPKIEDKSYEKTGTKITFLPDREIFEDIEPEYDIIASYLREASYLIKNLKITLRDLKNKKEEVFYSPVGIVAYLNYLFTTRLPLFSPPIYIEGERENIKIEAVIQYFSRYYDKNIISFANTIRTFEGGAHLEGFRAALTNAIQNYIKKHNLLEPTELMPERIDIEEGVGAILNVFLPQPRYSGIEKTYLDNREVERPIREFLEEKLSEFLEKNPKTAKLIVDKVKLARKVRTTIHRVEEITREGFARIPPPPKYIYYKPPEEKPDVEEKQKNKEKLEKS